MNPKALFALCVVIFLPLVSYLLVKYYSDNAVVMPRRFYVDSVSDGIRNGKQFSDTIWHKSANISLTNQLGDQVSLDQLKGKIIIANFFFTRCPTICPTLTRNMKKLQDGFKTQDELRGTNPDFIHFVSFSVDPERDSTQALKKYADRFGVNPDMWWMLTGPKKSIYDFAINELKLGLQDGEAVDSNFIHSSRFVLLDRDRVVRGYYDGLDSIALDQLAQDLVFIMLEKDKKKKRNLFRR
ncbi:MAG: SCO family protein [Gloeobacteraceae cyanobacterium ES-bin-144]|nr:SCO family protein [Verrucomicrobiales bacterium]